MEKEQRLTLAVGIVAAAVVLGGIGLLEGLLFHPLVLITAALLWAMNYLT